MSEASEHERAAADQSATIAFLAEPAAYGRKIGAVERIDTHASVIFLAGDRAYKLKRAVRYPFLDYSTLALRRKFCEREVAINRRTAPAIYQGTVAVVRRADGTLAIDGAGTPVDYLVVMRRFDQGGLFSALADAGSLDGARITEAVDRVTDLHETAEVVAPDARSGVGPAGLAGVITDDLAELERHGAVFDAATVERYRAAVAAEFARRRPLLDRRAAAGFVRQCHGDLHLANIVLFDGRATLFDAIEFSDSIACIDVLYDLAFLLMDLDVRGLTPQANRALNRYLARTAEIMVQLEGLAALPLLLSVRAAIRAIVSALTAAKAEGAGVEEAAAAARRYLDAAQRYLAPATPTLMAVGGASGTGKSAVALALAPGIGGAPGALVWRTDEIRKQLAGLADDARLPPSAYTPAHHAAVYDEMYVRAAATLAAGHSCILDAVHGRPEERERARALAERHGAGFAGIWLEAPPERLLERVAARRGDASDAGTEVVRRQLAAGFGAIDWARVDADQPLDAVVAAVQALLAG